MNQFPITVPLPFKDEIRIIAVKFLPDKTLIEYETNGPEQRIPILSLIDDEGNEYAGTDAIALGRKDEKFRYAKQLPPLSPNKDWMVTADIAQDTIYSPLIKVSVEPPK